MTASAPRATDKLRAAQVAGLAGIKTATFTSYVSRRQAPPPDGHYDDRTPWWYRVTVENWRGLSPATGAAERAATTPGGIPAAEADRARRICQELWDAIPGAGPAARDIYTAAIAVLGQAAGDLPVRHQPASVLTTGDICLQLAHLPPGTAVAVVPSEPPDGTGRSGPAHRQVVTSIDIAYDHAAGTAGPARLWCDLPAATYHAFQPVIPHAGAAAAQP